MPGAHLILHLIAAVLGVWSMTLLCRLVLVRLHNRRAGPGAHDTIPLSPRQRTMGLLLAICCLPMAALLTFIGEGISGVRDYSNIDAALTTGAATLIMVAGGATCAGLFFDPPRGRRRCPRCWYDFRGITSPRCPECGHEIPSERALLRTRRSRAVVAIGPLLVIIALGLYAVRLGRDGRAASLLPTPVMIAGIPWLPLHVLRDDDNSLAERIWEGRITAAQVERVRAKCRSVIGTSRDLETIDRVAILGGRYFVDRPDLPVIHPSVAASIYADLFSPDVRVAQLAEERWQRLRWCMPRRIDAGQGAENVIPILLNVVNGSDDAASRTAWQIAAEIGPAAAPLFEAARRHINQVGLPPSVRARPLPLIATLASSNNEAWRLLVEIVAESPELLWTLNENLADYLAPDFAAIEPRAAALLDNDPRVAPWAAELLVTLSPAPDAHLPRLLAAMSADPAIARQIIVPLARRTPTPEVAGQISRLLRSDHPSDADMGGQACAEFGGDRTQFLPLLHERRESVPKWSRQPYERAIQAIQTSQTSSGAGEEP